MAGWNDKIIEEFRAKKGRGITHFGDNLLLLTTRGAKTGREHTVPLAYHRDGDHYVIVASMGGAPRHPAWYHNLVAAGEAEVEVGSERFKVHVTPVTGGPERDRLYGQQAEMMPGFREYETKTTRVIPVVVLDRLDQARQAA